MLKSLLVLALSSISANVIVHTVRYPGENTWEITNADGAVVCSGGPFEERNKDYPQGCVTTEKNLTLKCIDNYGDGWHGGYIMFHGVIYCRDFRNGHLETHQLQNPMIADRK